MTGQAGEAEQRYVTGLTEETAASIILLSDFNWVLGGQSASRSFRSAHALWFLSLRMSLSRNRFPLSGDML
ncbi:hypothetical protein RFN28_14790 [Mesorhizobium sp. VK24D]|uniref:Uncharacterized protein n=1 Tax=Mesorhizobium album TaxID=3072314 RepID=A0ABU4XYI4_9HYPH|nr:hypothetical protein [Mesorhizobium sp. VK24D]MDX8479740.1 hypothetical protein [Mesorhizobium sp. VK24D]